jgi:hypothetical protein
MRLNFSDFRIAFIPSFPITKLFGHLGIIFLNRHINLQKKEIGPQKWLPKPRKKTKVINIKSIGKNTPRIPCPAEDIALPNNQHQDHLRHNHHCRNPIADSQEDRL